MNKVEVNYDKYINSFKVPIIKLDEFNYRYTDDIVLAEYPFTLVINGEYKKTFLCTQFKLEELIVGYLLTKGYIKEIEDIISLEIDKNNRITNAIIKEQQENMYETMIELSESNCIKYDLIDSNISIYVDTIYEIMNMNLNYSRIFKDTGESHCVAIFNNDEEVVVCEDIVRSNAIDKAIGYCILNDIPLKDKLILINGRVSFEILSKIAKAKIPIIISKSTPTNLSVELARKLNITLIGSIRGKRMNIYTHSQRIKA